MAVEAVSSDRDVACCPAGYKSHGVAEAAGVQAHPQEVRQMQVEDDSIVNGKADDEPYKKVPEGSNQGWRLSDDCCWERQLQPARAKQQQQQSAA